jgi:pyruvate/2-oxoglutarate dehydrogenase complex dihydrolipoamide dehydrogenase (E3) component
MCRIEKNEDGTLTVHYKGKDGQEHSLVAGIVMFGTGRKPNTNRLGIEVRPAGCQLPLRQRHCHHTTRTHQPSCRHQWLDPVTNPS